MYEYPIYFKRNIRINDLQFVEKGQILSYNNLWILYSLEMSYEHL